MPVIGLSGAQGAGKTTLASEILTPTTASFSLDDVYLASTARRDLVQRLQPLFATRGAPGTHDMTLFAATLDALQSADANSRTPIPAFDKVADEPVPRERWPIFHGRPDLILIDGWCLGATPQSDAELAAPINALEAIEDPDAVWRIAANAFLAEYQAAFAHLDAILYLEAPSFDVVLDWRCQQEEGLLGRPLTEADRTRIARFIAHFERITRHMLAGGRRADVVIRIDRNRNVIG